MTAASNAARFRIGVLLALALGLALGSFWLLKVLQRRGEADQPDLPRIAPDYYVNKFTFVKNAKSKTARYNISGDVLTHYPADDSYEIIHPIINNLSNGRPAMVMHADKALVNSDTSQIQMIDHVEIDRPASPQIEHFHLTSTYLMLLPDDDIMKTDKPVDLLLGTSKLAGTGMLANNATRQLDLSSRVHGTYIPVPIK